MLVPEYQRPGRLSEPVPADRWHTTMTTHFARHEQFLRIWKLLEQLETSRRPVADDELVEHLKEALGLTSLSLRTLGRDCEFLASCGYPVERQSVPEGRKQGWFLAREVGEGKRWMPREPLTLLEVTAFLLGREHLRFAEGTVLWTGVESLWDKIAGTLPEQLTKQVAVMRNAWHVEVRSEPAYADRPRLLSLLCAAITDCCEVDLTLASTTERSADHPAADGNADKALAADAAKPVRTRFRPHGMAVCSPQIGVVGFPAGSKAGPPLVIDLSEIATATPRDKVFKPCGETVRDLVARAQWTDGTPVM